MKSLSRHDREVVFSSLLKSKEKQRKGRKEKQEKQEKQRKENKWDIFPIFISGKNVPLKEKFVTRRTTLVFLGPLKSPRGQKRL